jgi:peptide deformylase
VTRVDAALRKLVAEMFDLMYEANGVGLAGNQVALPLRLFVVNMDAEQGQGEELIFINPVLSHPKGNEEGDEGCLSLPGLYGNVVRAKQIHVQAYNLRGEEFSADLDGLSARVIQHENDHLDGVLFTDRMTTVGKLAMRESLEEFELEQKSLRDLGQLESDQEIDLRLAEWVQEYCQPSE